MALVEEIVHVAGMGAGGHTVAFRRGGRPFL